MTLGSSVREEADVIIVGAGIAGITAARDIARKGLRVLLLEARDRLGGRIYSSQPKGWPEPVELGAEFVHGGNPALRAVLKAAAIATHPITEDVWLFQKGQLRLADDYWERIGKVAERIPRTDHGWSFREFLRRQEGKVSAADGALTEAYVGSFNAAHTDEIAAHAVRSANAGSDTEDRKMAGRYDSLVEAVTGQWPAGRVVAHLNSVVTAVNWRRGHVNVQVRAHGGGAVREYNARGAVITLPLGVWKAGTVTFSPSLARKESLLKRLGWGRVIRVVLRFRPDFWSAPFLPPALPKSRGKKTGFINAVNETVPVWWALHAPTPIFTGWAGGQAADRLIGSTTPDVLGQAISSLSHIFDTRETELKRWLVDSLVHDWNHDPFSLGAYSFPLAGEEAAPAKFAAPVQDTLYFAGEAFAEDFGTVHGAMDSGVSVGRQLIKAWK